MVRRHQLFCMMILYGIGSSTLFALGIKSKQDAWIVVLLATIIGLLLIWMYILLQKRHPGKGIGEIIVDVCGPVIGFPLVIFYVAYFIYSASINLRDFCELVSITQLEYTPLPVIMVIIILPVLYLLFCGVAALAKSSEILFPWVAVSLILIFILVITSNILHPDFLLPVFSNGIKSLFTSDFVRIIESPYGEMVAFLTLWKYADKPSGYVKPAVTAIFFIGIFEAVTVIIIICTLGAEFASVSTIPLYKVIGLINIKDIITDLNVVGVVLIFIGGFFKICVFSFAAVLTFESAFKINRNIIIAMIGSLICFNTLTIKGFIQHIWSANIIRVPYIHGIFTIAIPLMLLIDSIAKPSVKEKVND